MSQEPKPRGGSKLESIHDAIIRKSVQLSVVSHDAGGAQVVSSWLNSMECGAKCAVSGPAMEIFEKNCPELPRVSKSDALFQCDVLLTSTGWQTKFEIEAIAIAKERKVKVASYLDHWVNYRERFLLNGELILPDEIWVGDQHAKKIAIRNFPKSKILLIENEYFKKIKSYFQSNPQKIRPNGVSRLLYVTEPTKAHRSASPYQIESSNYDEFDALEYFIEALPKVFPNLHEVIIRPHPAENSLKYQDLISRNTNLFKLSTNLDLYEDIKICDAVAGCNSMALVVGVLSGRKVFCSIPPVGDLCHLPHNEIVMIRDCILMGTTYD